MSGTVRSKVKIARDAQGSHGDCFDRGKSVAVSCITGEHERVSRSILLWCSIAMLVLVVSLAAWFVRAEPVREVEVEPAGFATKSASPIELAADVAAPAEREVVVDPSIPSRVIRVRVVHDEDDSAFPGAVVEFAETFSTPKVQRIADESGWVAFDIADWRSVRVRTEAVGRTPKIVWYRDPPHMWKRAPTLDEIPKWSRGSDANLRPVENPIPDEIELRLVAVREVEVRLVDVYRRAVLASELGLNSVLDQRMRVKISSQCDSVGTHADARSFQVSRDNDRFLLPGATPAWRTDVHGRERVCVLAVLGTIVVGSVFLEPDAAEIEVPIARGIVDAVSAPFLVRVVAGAQDEPVADALVDQYAGSVAGGPSTSRVRTDARGQARFSPMLDGVDRIDVQATGYATTRMYRSEPMQSVMVVRLQPGRRLDGVVQDANGKPLSSANIALYRVGEGVKAPRVLLAKSSRDGTFRFTDLDRTTYAVGVGSLGSFEVSTNPDSLPLGFQVVDCTVADVTGLIVNEARDRPALPKRPGPIR